jgi:hypothetical protein
MRTIFIALFLALAAGAQTPFTQTVVRQFRTLAEMDASGPSRTEVYSEVAYNLRPGDLGGPIKFRYDPTNALPTNAVIRAVPSGVGRRVHDWGGDVRVFGAQINDGIDDSVAISNAMVYARSSLRRLVRLPAGDYHQQYSIPLIDRVDLVGESPAVAADGDAQLPSNARYSSYGNTRIILMNGANVPQLVLGPTNGLYARQVAKVVEDGSVVDSYEYNSSIRNIVFFGNAANQTRYDCHGFKFEHAWNIKILDCAFVYQSGYQGWLKDCNQVEMRSIYGSGTTAGGGLGFRTKGFFFWGCADSMFDNFNSGYVGGPKMWLTGESMWQSKFDGMYLWNNSTATLTVTNLSTVDGTITVSTNHTYETGMPVELFADDGGAMAGGVEPMRPYWAIKVSTNSVKLATTVSNALAGVAVIPTTTGTNLSLWHGPGAGLYVNWNANNLTIQGGRFDQNDYAGIVLHDAERVSIMNNNLKFNGLDNTAATTGTSAPVPYLSAGIVLHGLERSHIISGNVFDRITPNLKQDYGIWIRTNPWTSAVLSSQLPVRFSENTGMRDGTNIFYSSTDDAAVAGLSSFTPAEIGNTNIGTALTLKGNASGVRILRMQRQAGSPADIGIGISAGSAQFYDETAAKTLVFVDGSTTNLLGLTLGSTAAQAATRTSRILTEAASGTNSAAGALEIRQGAGTGISTNNGISFVLSVPGTTTNAVAQTVSTLFRVRAFSGMASNDLPLEISTWNGSSFGTIRRVAVTNISGVDVWYLKP